MRNFIARAHVLQDGHIDHITGPRCMIKPIEGEHVGRYLIAHTLEVLKQRTPVVYDYITGRATKDDGKW